MRRRLEQLHLAYFEVGAIHLVHGQERRGQAASTFKELPPSNSELFRARGRQLLDPLLDAPLFIRLRVRHVLAIGNHPGWDG